MIMYEYRCIACRTMFSLRRMMADRNLPTKCPDCGGPGRRVISCPQPHKSVWQQQRDPEELRRTPELWK